jgi:DNA-binding IclR family transcriptional regulator
VLGQDNQLVGALTISGPKLRFDCQDAGVRRFLLEQAVNLAAQLGCPQLPDLQRRG